MNGLAIFLVFVSTFFHAGWNLQARYLRSEKIFFKKMLIGIALAGLLPVVGLELFLGHFPGKVYLLSVCSGFFCGIYYLGLARSYQKTDFTAAYPLVRAMPVIVVSLFDLLRGRVPNQAGWVGLSIVALGCLLTPLQSFRGIRIRHYFNQGTSWILLAAAGTVGYTVIDKAASELVPRGPVAALRYCYFFFAFSSLFYIFLLRVFDKRAPEKGLPGWRASALGASFNFASYALVIWAYQLSRYAGYVIALRQFSIVIAVILGAALFKEGGIKVRIPTALVICAGIFVLAMWG